MEKSLLQNYSRGIVLEDKERNSTRIKVRLIEINFIAPTPVQAVQSTNEVAFSSNGSTDYVSVESGNDIEAKWWSHNSNRVTPPNVKKGDEVIISRLGKTDIYFWEDLNTSNVKTLEEVVYAWAADPENKMANDLSNAYSLAVSPLDGHITIRTTSANGEPATYLIQVNTRDGGLIATDNFGNKFFINSITTDVGFENACGTKVNALKEELFLYAKKRIRVDTTLLEMVDTTYKHTSKSWIAKSNSYTHESGTIKFTATYTLNGSSTIKGHITNTGGASFDGIEFGPHFHLDSHQAPCSEAKG